MFTACCCLLLHIILRLYIFFSRSLVHSEHWCFLFKLCRIPFFVCVIYFLLIVCFYTRDAGQELSVNLFWFLKIVFSLLRTLFLVFGEVNIFRAFFFVIEILKEKLLGVFLSFGPLLSYLCASSEEFSFLLLLLFLFFVLNILYSVRRSVCCVTKMLCRSLRHQYPEIMWSKCIEMPNWRRFSQVFVAMHAWEKYETEYQWGISNVMSMQQTKFSNYDLFSIANYE